MAVTNYYSVGGRIIGEETSGVRTNYLTDALGSVTATVDATGTVQNTYRYKPYGALLAKTGTAVDPVFMWTGTRGQRVTGLDWSRLYSRNRHYISTLGQWTTLSHNWPSGGLNSYSSGKPATVFGYKARNCQPNLLIKIANTHCHATCNGSCQCDFLFSWHVTFLDTSGCSGCKFYQWFQDTVNGETQPLYKDSCDKTTTPPKQTWPWPSMHPDDPTFGATIGNCWTTATWSSKFFSCVCCDNGCSCSTWTVEGHANCLTATSTFCSPMKGAASGAGTPVAGPVAQALCDSANGPSPQMAPCAGAV